MQDNTKDAECRVNMPNISTKNKILINNSHIIEKNIPPTSKLSKTSVCFIYVFMYLEKYFCSNKTVRK